MWVEDTAMFAEERKSQNRIRAGRKRVSSKTIKAIHWNIVPDLELEGLCWRTNFQTKIEKSGAAYQLF